MYNYAILKGSVAMGSSIFRRKIYDRMLQWKQESDGKSALLIQGARRVGKSTIVEEFAQKEYKSHILIDFSLGSGDTSDLFHDMSDLNFFFLRLQLLYNVDLYERESAIIFDEVQSQPLARQAIKHLVKDGRYDYIETGSLLSIKKNIINIIIPSEETRLSMHPMDYEEFRWALGDETTIPLIKAAFEKRKPLGDDVNRKLMRDFRLYMLIGGMPQAVSEYISTNNLGKVDQIKRNILDLYQEDFRKIDSSGRASLLFSAIPSELSKKASRYQVSSVDARSRSSRVADIVADMLDSMTVYSAYHADDPGVGFSLHKNPDKYKLFLADTGLFVTMAFKDKDITENIIYEKLLSDKLPVNLGHVYENAVAQMLRASGNELYYHTMPSPTSNRNYEIDFLLSRNNKICPVEVKSSRYKTHVSLDRFIEKYPDRIAEKYIVYTKDLRKDKDIIMLPAYMVPFL